MSCSDSSLSLSIIMWYRLRTDTDVCVLFVPAGLATSTWHRVRAIILIVQDVE
jgi:hypothetical protein